MLILNRHTEESIVIGGDIEVKIIGVKGDIVRLGITAPSEIPVHRKEVQDAINRERLSAVGLQS